MAVAGVTERRKGMRGEGYLSGRTIECILKGRGHVRVLNALEFKAGAQIVFVRLSDSQLEALKFLCAHLNFEHIM